MWGLSVWHWAIVGGVVMLLFGRNMFSRTMTDLAGGLKELKKGMREIADGASEEPRDPHIS